MQTRCDCHALAKVMMGSLARSMRLLYMIVVLDGMKLASKMSRSFLLCLMTSPCGVSMRSGVKGATHE